MTKSTLELFIATDDHHLLKTDETTDEYNKLVKKCLSKHKTRLIKDGWID